MAHRALGGGLAIIQLNESVWIEVVNIHPATGMHVKSDDALSGVIGKLLVAG